MMMNIIRDKGCSSVPPTPKPHPWLMFSHGRHSEIQTFYSIPEDRYYMRKLPDLSGKIICASCEGWMMIVDNHKDPIDCFLLNLVSMEKVKLPPLQDFDDELGQLSSPPTEPNCIVAFFRRDQPPRAMIWRPGQENWVEQIYSRQEDDILRDAATVIDRKIYSIVNHGRDLAVLEMADDDDQRLELRKLGAEEAPYCLLPEVIGSDRYLIECNGDMFLILWGYRGESETRIQDIDVFRYNKKSLDWSRVDDIGDRAFFISQRANSMSCCGASESGLKGNSIYFTYWGDSSLYVFDLKGKTIFASRPCPKVPNLSPARWVNLSP